MALCAKGSQRKWCRLSVEEAWAGMGTDLWAYVHPGTNVVLFNYLERILMDMCGDWLALVPNLR